MQCETPADTDVLGGMLNTGQDLGEGESTAATLGERD